jgi:alpha-beta hydrolase superfamily lysophospholipase
VGYRAIPSHYGLIYEEVTFQTSDSLSIRGWFFPAQDTAGIAHRYVGRLIPMPSHLRPPQKEYELLDVKPRPTVVICNGDAGNMTFLILYAYHLCTNGFNVLTFDWRGFGESEAWPIDSNQLVYSEFLLDYDAAIDFAKERAETDRTRIGLLGFSTGA